MTWPNHVRGFDSERFIADALAYCTRHGMSRSELIRASGFDLSSGLGMLGRVMPTLSFVCVVSDLCDLSLDTYRVSTWEEAAS